MRIGDIVQLEAAEWVVELTRRGCSLVHRRGDVNDLRVVAHEDFVMPATQFPGVWVEK
jgi:hypothetical protein